MGLLLLFDDFAPGAPGERTDLFLSEPTVRTHRLLFDEVVEFIPASRFGVELTEPEVRTHRLLFDAFEEPPGVLFATRTRLLVAGAALVISAGVRVTVETMRPRWQQMRPHE